ncbi:MAG: DUF1573 domain-containing protein [Thermoguttaceae bacterium]
MRLSSFFVIAVSSVIAGLVLGGAMLYSVQVAAPWSPDDEKLTAPPKGHQPPPPAPATSRARVDSGPVDYDFGIAEQGGKGEHVFTITSVGEEPLLLSVGEKTCSCTDVKLSKTRLAPGEKGEVKLWWDGERATGRFRQGAAIITNDPNVAEVVYHVEGLYCPAVLVQPSELILGEVRASATKTATVRIYSFESEPIAITSISWPNRERYDAVVSPAELDKADLEDTLRKHAKSVVAVTITMNPGNAVGSFLELFSLETNSRREPKVSLAVRGQIVSDWVSIAGVGYSRETGTVRLGKTQRGVALKGEFVVHLTGPAASRGTLSIREVSPPWLKATVGEPRDIGQRRICTVSLEVPAGAPVCNMMQPDTAAVIVLDTQVAEVPTLKVPVTLAVEQ